ncbi:MAG TPA: cupredoxin domain-containing protein [Candidatus Paceibacterota bacterium]|nr:cupredoxin domain-containing protein [Candidatus Paceibacterota bacterium]
MKNKGLAVSILGAGIIIAFAIILAGGSGGGSSAGSGSPSNQNVSVADGTQYIDIAVKGGYYPRITRAKAGIPTKLRLKTNGTFDCSSAVVIPSLGYRSYLPQTGTTEVDIPPQAAGTALQGLCAMGMYNFRIQFE